VIEVENKYDFSVEELTDILEQTPIAVEMSTNEAVAKYIIQALNINRIIKFSNSGETVHTAPYHLEIVRNKDGKKMFASDARTIAFYAYDPAAGRPYKVIISEEKPKPTDIANVCELLGDINSWGTFQ
jgi:hypothetical protein